MRTRPARADANAADRRLLINFRDGGFMVGSGSLTETIPIAGLTGMPVVTVMYRMAHEHPFLAAVNDALAVCHDALAQRPASAIGVSFPGAVLFDVRFGGQRGRNRGLAPHGPLL